MAKRGDCGGDPGGYVYGEQSADGAYSVRDGYGSCLTGEGLGMDYGCSVTASLAHGIEGGEPAGFGEWRDLLGRGDERDDDAALCGCARGSGSAGGENC